MGFFERFTSTLDDWNFRWSDAGTSLGNSWDAVRGGWAEQQAIVSNLWGTAFGGHDAKESADAFWASKGLLDRAMGQFDFAGEAVGGVVGAATQMPGIRQGLAFADAAQRELVGRPLATASLMRGDAVNERDSGIFLDADRWKQAYNSTTYVTPGQALVFATGSTAHGFVGAFGVEPTAEQRKSLIVASPLLGTLLQDPKNYDPRVRDEGRRAYYDNALLKGVSGTMDVGITIFGDPTVIGGKAARLAKLRYVSDEMSAAAIQSGRLESHIDSKSYRQAKDFIGTAENSEVVRRRMFNNHYDGGLVSALLFDAARTQDAYEKLGGTVDLYDTTFRALYGEVEAWETLTREARHYADAIGSERANYSIAEAAKRYGTGDGAVDARVETLIETKAEAWVDATANGYGMWGKVEDAPLAGQAVPRLRATSAWRTGVHSFVRNKVPTIAGHWARRAAYALPSQRSGRMLDLNDANSASVLRNTLALSRMSQHETDRWVGAYARATSPEARFNIYNAAENYAFRLHARAYGLTREQLDALIPVMNRHRKGNRQILSANRRYASEDVQKAYERALQENRLQSAAQLQTIRHNIDEAVKRGEHPDAFFALPDEHGQLTLIPQDSNLRLDQPIILSQHADVVPVVDWNVLENALWWHVGFGRGKPAKFGGQKGEAALAKLGEIGYSVQDISRGALEAAMSVWKVTAILRPGYVWRTLSDELGRVWSLQKSFTSLATMGRGVANTSHNMRTRSGRLMGEGLSRRVTAARARGEVIEVDADAVETGASVEVPDGVRLTADDAAGVGADLTYPTLEHMLGDGVLGVPDYIARVEAMGEAGTLPPRIAEIFDSHRNGIKPDDEYRRDLIDEALLSVNRAAYTSPAWQQVILGGVLRERQMRSAGTAVGVPAASLDASEIARIKEKVSEGMSLDDAAPRALSADEYRILREGLAAGKNAKRLRVELSSLTPAPAGGRPAKWGEPTLVDPLTGTTPDLTRTQVEKFVIVDRRTEFRPDPDGSFQLDMLYHFVADNIDELMKPRRMLHVQLTPHGNLSLGVGRSIHPEAPVKPTGGVRVELPWRDKDRDAFRDSGSADIVVNTPAGRIAVQGAFIGGEGARFRAQASNRGPDDAWVDTKTDIEFGRFTANSGRWTDVGPDTWADYRGAWARAVNKQLGNDEVARQFMQGKSYNDVLLWMFNTPQGRAYHWRMGPLRSQFAEQVSMVQSMVNTYVPMREAKLTESITLREKVMRGDATADDLEAVVGRSEMPKVHGASLEYATGRGPIMDGIKRTTDKVFRILSDLPNDKLVRFPFAAERYTAHVQELANVRGVHKARAGQTFTPDDLRSIERVARRRALQDVQRYLFQTNATLDLSKALRLAVPFGSALSDSFLKWGLVLRENPTSLIQVWKVWNSPERAGLVADQDGNELELEDGREAWYSVDPSTGERTRLEDHRPKDRFITFRLPSWLSERYYGDDVRPQVRINKRVFRTALDLPTAGPLVAVPANKFALDNPEFAENEFVKQWILPLGATSDSSAVIIPSNVQNLRRTVFPEFAEQDRRSAEAQAIAIFAADMTSHSLGQRANPPTFEEAREKAAAMRGIRFWASFFGVSPQIQSPYQPYVDYYRQLRTQEAELRRKAAEEGRDQAEVPAADQLFYEQMGDEYFALTARVTRNALGIPATIGSHRAYKKYQDLIDKHPDIASLIIGQEGAGEFSRSVYEAQKLQPLRPGSAEKQRERLSPEESWADQQRRRGWLEYGKFQDMVTNDLIRLGLTSVEQRGAERVKAFRDAWITERQFVNSPWGETVLNPWFEDFRTIDGSRMTGRLHSLRDIVQDRRLQGRDEIRGLAAYLQLRTRFRNTLERNGFASLASPGAEALRGEWQRTVFELREQSPSFSALHDRWLTGDETLAARE